MAIHLINKEESTLFLRFSGSKQTVYDQIEKAQQAVNINECETFEVSGKKHDIEQIWAARKQVAPSLLAMKKDPSDLFPSADVAVPNSSLADMIDWTHQIIKSAGFPGSTLGHVGDGNLVPR
ncbi:MAG: hypothetical protein Q9209_006271 [Squamulea sp. 1 TL-2023]